MPLANHAYCAGQQWDSIDSASVITGSACARCTVCPFPALQDKHTQTRAIDLRYRRVRESARARGRRALQGVWRSKILGSSRVATYVILARATKRYACARTQGIYDTGRANPQPNGKISTQAGTEVVSPAYEGASKYVTLRIRYRERLSNRYSCTRVLDVLLL